MPSGRPPVCNTGWWGFDSPGGLQIIRRYKMEEFRLGNIVNGKVIVGSNYDFYYPHLEFEEDVEWVAETEDGFRGVGFVSKEAFDKAVNKAE